MAVSILQLVGLGVLGLGVILHIVGTATRGWMTADHASFDTYAFDIDLELGLFKTCYIQRCDDTKENKWVRAVKALTLSGVVLSLLAGLLALVAIVLRSKKPKLSSVPSVICLVLCLLAGLLIFIGVIIFGVKVFSSHIVISIDGILYIIKVDSSLGYSFGLCITGGILIVVGGAMVSAVCLQKPNNNQPVGTTAAAQSPPMLYPSQAGGMVYQNQAGGMAYQPQAGGMAYQPQAGGMAYQPQAGGMDYPVQAGGMIYKPQAGAMAYQPQPGGMVSQNQEGGMSHSSGTTKEKDNAK